MRSLNSIVRDQRPDVLTGIMGQPLHWPAAGPGYPRWSSTTPSSQPSPQSLGLPDGQYGHHPNCYQNKFRAVTLPDAGYHELAYLHPDHFTPDVDRIRGAELDPSEPILVVRFVSWMPATTSGRSLSAPSEKKILVDRLGSFGRVVISSEKPLPADLEQYALRGT